MSTFRLVRRRPPQFGLRALFVLTLGAAVLLAVYRWLGTDYLVAWGVMPLTLAAAGRASWIRAWRKWRERPEETLLRTRRLLGRLDQMGLRDVFRWWQGEALAAYFQNCAVNLVQEGEYAH